MSILKRSLLFVVFLSIILLNWAYNHSNKNDSTEFGRQSSLDESSTAKPNEVEQDSDKSNDQPQPKEKTLSTHVICSNYASRENSVNTDFIQVSLRIKNLTNSPIKIEDAFFSLMDNEGDTYAATNEFAGENNNLFIDTLNPHVEKAYTLTYEISKKATYSLQTNDDQNIKLNPKKSCLGDNIEDAGNRSGLKPDDPVQDSWKYQN